MFKDRMFSRRTLLKTMLLSGAFGILPFARNAWALTSSTPTNKRMIVILLRGAVDGLSVVTPFGERNYYAARPTIALPSPGKTGGLLNLDNFFGLHPALSPVYPLWQNQSLAFIHASGSPSTTRSHFMAQDILETALLNSATAKRGWLSALSQTLPDNHSATRLISFGNTLPKIFQGTPNVATVPTKANAKAAKVFSQPQVANKLGQLYASNPELAGLYSQAAEAQQSISMDLSEEMEKASNGAPDAKEFAASAAKAAELVRKDSNVQIVFMDVGGWDTHVNQGSSDGQLANKLTKLGQGLATLAQGLGDAYRDTAILVMSEFGRTAAQNGNGGTDHGHGNVAWLMGGAVRGGRVWGRWPGLDTSQLYEGRDLAVTTDFRSIIGAVASAQFGLDPATLGSIIPDYTADEGLRGIIA